MIRKKLKSKIHIAIVTEANVNYKGSITIDTELMKAADIQENELVHVNNATTGVHWETYAIPGKKGEICLNGAAAYHFKEGDKIHIISYALFDKKEKHNPTLIYCDDKNNVLKNLNINKSNFLNTINLNFKVE